MMTRTFALTAALAVPLFFGRSAHADQGKEGAKPAALSETEIQSMAKLHHANEMEIDMGKLGTEKAKAPAVKSYAKKMVDDHTKADAKVMALAKKRGATLTPPTPTDADKKAMEEQMGAAAKLRSLEGDEFDREFMAAMVKDHASALALVTDAQSKANDKEAVALFKGAKTVIEKHKAAADKLAAKQAADKSKAPATPAPPKGT